MGQQAEVEAALQKGSAKELATYFNKNVELSIPDIEDSFTADKAVQTLDVFFTGQTVKGYKRVHLSAPQEGRSNYSIGDLYTAKGTYRITIYYDSTRKITEIRIQR
jgi:hypothetical protein